MTDNPIRLTRAFEEQPEQTEDLNDLYERLNPKITAAELRQIEQILNTAQRAPPADPLEFVRKMNRLFDVCRVRIRTDDGTFGRLCCLRRKSGNPYIQLSYCRGGFLKARLSVVRVSENYNGAHPNKRWNP